MLLVPLNLLLRKQPQDIGLHPGRRRRAERGVRRAARQSNIVDPQWAAVEWTLSRALRTARFWWIALGYCRRPLRLVRRAGAPDQISHRDRRLGRRKPRGRSVSSASFGVPGQIIFGHLSDRIGREWVWAIGCLGFAICYAALIALQAGTSPVLLYTMVLAQGFLGYSPTPRCSARSSRRSTKGRTSARSSAPRCSRPSTGGAVGPWVTGLIYDHTGSYDLGFWIALAACALSALAIFIAAPRKVRLVAGKLPKRD